MKFLLVCFFCLCLNVYSQEMTINLDGINEGERLYEYVRISKNDSTVFGTVYERITKKPDQNKIVFEFRQELPRTLVIDSVIVDSRSMVPLNYSSNSAKYQDIQVNYLKGEKIEINLKRNLPNKVIDTLMNVEYTTEVYDFHWPHILLYGFSQFKSKGTKLEFPVFTYNNFHQVQDVHYGGKQDIKVNDIFYKAIIWKMVNKNSGTKHTYWIDIKTSRLLLSKSELLDGSIFLFKLKKKVEPLIKK